MLGRYDIVDFKGDAQIASLHKTLTVPACWIIAAPNWSLCVHFLFLNWGAHSHFLNWIVLFIQTLPPGLLVRGFNLFVKTWFQKLHAKFKSCQFTLVLSKCCTHDAVWLTNSWCESVNKTNFNVGMPLTHSTKLPLTYSWQEKQLQLVMIPHYRQHLQRHPCMVLLNQFLLTSCCSSTFTAYWFKAGVRSLQLFDPSAAALSL